MKKLLALLALLIGVTFTGNIEAQTRLVINADVSWGRSTLTLNGSSQTLLAATAPGSASRKGFIVVNPAANNTAYINLAGTTATTSDIPLAPGTWTYFMGETGPYNAVTVIGTNTNVLTIFTGT